ncbi:MAG: NAD(P)/FAD-dependent oxidoreductase [Coprobacillus sp.]|nr:NAD(P)/FAD-dependent oxidoreductase [Coprobacillus sp.]
MYDVLIIGAGVIGGFIGRDLARYKLKVCVLEKNNDVTSGSSASNSAIIHSGYDPKEGSLKQKFNLLGNPAFDKVCDELDVPFKRVGSLTLATSEDELNSIKDLYKQGQSYKVKVSLLNRQEVKALEPNISDDVLGGLYAPSAAIIDPFSLTNHLFENAIDNGVKLFLNQEVIDISLTSKGSYEVKTKDNLYRSKVVINCAGLYADKVAEMIEDVPWKIIPKKGQYYVIDHSAKPFVNHIIFPTPTLKGKGILVTPTAMGDYLVGPTSDIVDDVDDTSTNSLTGAYIKENASKLIKDIPFKDSIRVFSGVRAASSTGDFIIEGLPTHKTFINVAGIESPGLSSSPAIGDYVVKKLVLPLFPNIKEKPYFNPRVRRYIRFKDLTEKEKEELIKKDPSYGEIVCVCEQISLGEILDLFTRPNPPTSIKAIRKRLELGFGKCQGGFCTPKLVKILASYFKVDMNEINYDNQSSYILKEKVKK